MSKIDPAHIMRIRILNLKSEIERYEMFIDDYIKKISDAEKEIEAIKILMENADFTLCATPRTLRAYENER